jgi:flagellar biosynthesis/type III secretory pathway chaperone
MTAVILTSEQYQEIIQKLDELKSQLAANKNSVEVQFIDNQQFIKLMSVSKRTAQTWRDEGIISFSQVGSKIYYRMSDVKKMLDSNYKPSFKNVK